MEIEEYYHIEAKCYDCHGEWTVLDGNWLSKEKALKSLKGHNYDWYELEKITQKVDSETGEIKIKRTKIK